MLALVMVAGLLTGCTNTASGGQSTNPPAQTQTPENTPESTPENTPSDEPTYKTPSRDYTEWQEYTDEQYLAEDVDAKQIAYQINGDGEVQSFKSYVMYNLYEDGMATVHAYMVSDDSGRLYTYYGYWANMDDDHLFVGTLYYTVSMMPGICTIGYTNELYKNDGVFEPFQCTLSLGFQNAGLFSRTLDMPASDGEIKFSSVADFVAFCESESNVKTAYSDEAPAQDDSNPAYKFSGSLGNFLATDVILRDNKTAKLSCEQASVEVEGSWAANDDGTLLITFNGEDIVVASDGNGGYEPFSVTITAGGEEREIELSQVTE